MSGSVEAIYAQLRERQVRGTASKAPTTGQHYARQRALIGAAERHISREWACGAARRAKFSCGGRSLSRCTLHNLPGRPSGAAPLFDGECWFD